MSRSCVVTGGGRGVGPAIAARLAADGGTVVIIEMDEAALDWVPGHLAADRLSGVTGSAADERVAAVRAGQLRHRRGASGGRRAGRPGIPPGAAARYRGRGARPVSRLWDLAYAVKGFVPLTGGGDPVADAPRLRALADGYGLSAGQRGSCRR
jgi:NAD(P)-dependent dehydrogenase (short-subunit alcohol dehydrogenase family)